MSNFKDVYRLNQVFQKPTTTANIKNPTVIANQFAVIEEEFNELKAAVETGDWEAIKDATGDILVTTYGMGYACQFDCDRLMKNISRSNFSKVCSTKSVAEATAMHYNKLGVEVKISEVVIQERLFFFFKRNRKCWIVKSAKDQTYIEDGKEKSIREGKFLKSIDWHEPSLDVEF